MGAYANFILAVLITGFSGIVAQTILPRETLIIFSQGNEFSIGIIIVMDCMGGNRRSYRRQDLGQNKGAWRIFELAHAALLCLFPCSVYLTRIAKILTGVSPDMGVGIVETLYYSLIILLLRFPMACSLLWHVACITGLLKVLLPLSEKYIFTKFGTIVGGVLKISYILIPTLNSFEIAIGVASLNALICLVMLLFRRTKQE